MITLQEVLTHYQDLPQFESVKLIGPNQRGFDGDTPLHVACRQGAVEHVMILLAAGADVNLPGDLGNTALHEAASYGHKDLVGILRTAGARIELQNECGQTARRLAELGGHEEIARLL